MMIYFIVCKIHVTYVHYEVNKALQRFHKHSCLFTYLLTQRRYSYEIWSMSNDRVALLRSVG